MIPIQKMESIIKFTGMSPRQAMSGRTEGDKGNYESVYIPIEVALDFAKDMPKNL